VVTCVISLHTFFLIHFNSVGRNGMRNLAGRQVSHGWQPETDQVVLTSYTETGELVSLLIQRVRPRSTYYYFRRGGSKVVWYQHMQRVQAEVHFLLWGSGSRCKHSAYSALSAQPARNCLQRAVRSEQVFGSGSRSGHCRGEWFDPGTRFRADMSSQSG